MSTNENTAKKPLSGLFTSIAVILFLGGFYLAGSAFFSAQAWYIRFAIVIISMIVSIISLMMTTHWNYLVELSKGAKIEIRKVFWPHKDEIVRTTLLVLAIVAIFALFLTIVDGILTLIVRWVLS